MVAVWASASADGICVVIAWRTVVSAFRKGGINGKDLQLEFKENYCATCSQVSGTHTDCRVWLYQGREYSAPPKAMIIEAVLQDPYGGSRSEPAKIVRPENALENLRQFFESKRQNELVGAV